MMRINAKDVVESGRCAKYLGVGLFVLVLAAGSTTVYTCSPTSLVPSDVSGQLPSDPSTGSSPEQTTGNSPQSTAGNSPSANSQSPARNDLSSMQTTLLNINGHIFTVWVAQTLTEQEYGLMWVQPSEIAYNQGMLFVFSQDQTDGFWMKNTLIPLDIAFIRSDGTVVNIQSMTPGSLAQHQPSVPYRHALEVNSGAFSNAGLKPGMKIQIPASVLN